MLRGLRGRFVAAMLLVGAVILAVTAFALFTPLENRLRTDQLASMSRAARADRTAFARLSDESLTVASSPLQHAARALRRGSGADVAVIGPRGSLLYATDVDDRVVSPQARTALRSGAIQKVVTAGDGGQPEARVAVPLTVDGRRIVVELTKSLASVQSAVHVVREAFLVAAAISLAVALLVGLLLAERLVRRLRALRDTALRVAQLGPTAELRSDDSRDEVGDLTRALVTMQEQLREQEQARRTFVATASHELRTPLTSLNLILDTLRGDLAAQGPGLESARDLAQRAEAQSQRLSQLAAELLDLSRIDAGLPLRRELVEAGETVRSVVAEFDVRLADCGRTIDLRIDGAQWALADPGSVAQIVRILLDNALRHAPAETPIRVAVGHDGGHVSVRVEDDGPGVRPETAQRIFERFERGDGPSEAPGFGLGLAIGRELARRMGGDLVLDPATAAGAAFELRLTTAPGS